MNLRSQWSVLVLFLLLVTSCSAAAEADGLRMRALPVLAGAHNDTSTPFNLVSMPALIKHRYDGRGLRIGGVLAQELTHTTHHVTYRSGTLRIGGALTVPTRPGRYPLVVLAHGFTDATSYRSGATMARERAYLTRRGYVVLQPDYRNHGDSDRDREGFVARPLGYPEDVVNAVVAVRRARLPFVDSRRVGLFGRSMGGGVALAAAAARPRLVDAVVLYSPVSSWAPDTFRRWVVGSGELETRVVEAYGRPHQRPRFWRNASVRSYGHRVDVPVQIHHGTADRVCPARWSRRTARSLRAAGQRVALHEYTGEGHAFDRSWGRLMRRSADFLDARV